MREPPETPDVDESDVLRNMRRQHRRNAAFAIVPVAVAVVTGLAFLVQRSWPSDALAELEVSREPRELHLDLSDSSAISFYAEVELTGRHGFDTSRRAPRAAIVELELVREGQVVDSARCPVDDFAYCPELQRHYHQHWACWLRCTVRPEQTGPHTLRASWAPGPDWPPEDVERIALTAEQR